jgi:hypothetical protein
MNKPKGFMNANGMIFAPEQSGAVFANLTAKALPCNGGDGGGGVNDLCCRGTVDSSGKFKCCAGGTASGTRTLGCGKTTTASSDSRGGKVTGAARLSQFGY